jgi:hypothetical protein
LSLEGNSLALTGLFPNNLASSDSWDFSYTIFNVLNPNAQQPGSYTITIFLGSAIAYKGTGISYIFSPTFGLQTVSFTASVLYPTIWAVSPLTLTITPNFAIDTIKITFPSKWALETASISGALIGNPTCSSASNPTATCAYLSSVFTVTNLYYFAAGVPIDVTIKSINNPSACVSAGPISISLFASGAQLQLTSGYSLPGSYFSNDVLRNPSSSLV